MDFYDREDRAARLEAATRIGKLIYTFHTVPKGLAAASYPSLGDLLPGTSGLTGARCRGAGKAQPAKSGFWRVPVVWIQPVAYSGVAAVGTYQEILGSRRIRNGAESRSAMCLAVASDLVNVPVRGDLYPADSGWLARRCVDVQHEMETVPGLHTVVSRYWAPLSRM